MHISSQPTLCFHLIHAHLLGTGLRHACHIPEDLQRGAEAEGGHPEVLGSESAASHRRHRQRKVEVSRASGERVQVLNDDQSDQIWRNFTSLAKF